MSSRGAGTSGSRGPRSPSAAATRAKQPRPFAVTFATERARDRLFENAGRTLSDAEIAGLGGAQPGSRVEVGRDTAITVHGPRGTVTTTFVLRSDAGVPFLLNFDYRGPGGTTQIPVSAKVLRTQVLAARALGFDSIHMKARVADVQRLPKLGYDAAVNANLLAETRTKALPAGIGRARLLSDVLASSIGRRWWRKNGLNPGLDFDLRTGSYSMRTLDAYLKAHKMPGLNEA